jgi:hypothetical protein
LMMRSENFVFDRTQAGSECNWMSGRVTERLFLGRSIEYQVQLEPSGEVLTVLDQRQESPALLSGGRIDFGILPQDVRVLAS